jgi:hypothetical protein
VTDTTSLLEAQRARQARVADAQFDKLFDSKIAFLFSEADTVGPDARHKLRGILRHYAKEPHPFRACVKDNMKRFGPGRTEAVCATLKDIIRGTTHWRGHPAEDHGSPGAIAATGPEIDEDMGMLLLSISEERLEAFVASAQEVYANDR